ncbi:MAG: DUF2281 domain-containing protein [Spirulinaceae cyanobacterium]
MNPTSTQTAQENLDISTSNQAPSTMIKSTILEKLETLPPLLQTEVLHYVEFLSERYVDTGVEPTSQLKKRGGLGILKGKIWMSEDFDEPLEDMKEYM